MCEVKKINYTITSVNVVAKTCESSPSGTSPLADLPFMKPAQSKHRLTFTTVCVGLISHISYPSKIRSRKPFQFVHHCDVFDVAFSQIPQTYTAHVRGFPCCGLPRR